MHCLARGRIDHVGQREHTRGGVRLQIAHGRLKPARENQVTESNITLLLPISGSSPATKRQVVLDRGAFRYQLRQHTIPPQAQPTAKMVRMIVHELGIMRLLQQQMAGHGDCSPSYIAHIGRLCEALNQSRKFIHK